MWIWHSILRSSGQWDKRGNIGLSSNKAGAESMKQALKQVGYVTFLVYG